MRVLLTTDTIGGVWTFTQELCTGLLEQGHTVALFSLGRMPSEAQLAWVLELEQQHGSGFRYEASEAPLEWMNDNVSAYEAAEDQLLRLIEDFRAEVLHASQFCFGALPVSIPKLVTAHSDVLSWADACRPEQLHDSPWLSNYQRLVEVGLQGFEALAAPTSWMLNALQRHFAFDGSTHVIANGLTLHVENDAKLRQLQAVSVGRLWDEAKQLSLLANVHSPMPILVAGEQRLGEATASNDLGEATLLGLLSGDEVRELFKSSSLYLVTSLYEPFGLAPLEAAQCGCGILANDLPSLREVWGDAALYFTDAESLSRLLSRLGSCPAALHTLRRHSLERAREFSRERMTNAYVALYQQLLASQLKVDDQVGVYVG